MNILRNSKPNDGKRPVLVINQYALPRNKGGGTRHIDLFGRLEKWRPTIVATSRNHSTGEVMTADDDRFVFLPSPAYHGNGIARMVGWGVFATESFLYGLWPKSAVVVGASPQLLVPASALALARIKRVPFVMEVRDLWPESIVAYGALQRGSALHKVLTALEAWLYRNAERIIVVTDGWEEHFASLGIDPAKLQVIPNGTEPKDFIVDADRETLRREYGIDGTTAIFAGSHGPKDGIPLILNAAAKLDGINFVLIGDGSAKDEAIAEAKARNLTNVEFRDPIPKSELPRLLRACDVGLHVVAPLDVFNKGMSPNKLFDYLASDLPVVTNARIPLQRVISDDEVGAVVDPDDIATGITRVLAADQSTRERWRAHAQMLMSTKYSRDAASRLLEQLLDEVVAGVPPRSAKA